MEHTIERKTNKLVLDMKHFNEEVCLKTCNRMLWFVLHKLLYVSSISKKMCVLVLLRRRRTLQDHRSTR